MRDANDWIAATGHPIVGRGIRPINPKLAHLVGKAAPSRSRPRSGSGAAHRRLMLAVYKAQAAASTAPSVPAAYRTRQARLQAYLKIVRRTAASNRRAARSAPIRDTSIMEQSQVGYAGIAAQAQHMAAVRASGRVYGPSQPTPRPKPRPNLGMNYTP